MQATLIDLEPLKSVCHSAVVNKEYGEFYVALEKIFALLHRENVKIIPSVGLNILNELFIDIVKNSKGDAQFVVGYFEMLAMHEIELSQRYRFDLFGSLYNGCGVDGSDDSWLYKTLKAKNHSALKVLLQLASTLICSNQRLEQLWKSTLTFAMRAANDEESLRLLLEYGANPLTMSRFYWRMLIDDTDYWKMLHEVFDHDTLTQLVGRVSMFRIALRQQDVDDARLYMHDNSPYGLLTNSDKSSVADSWKAKADVGLWRTVTKIFSAKQLQDAFGAKVAFYSAVVHGDVAIAKNLLTLGGPSQGNIELLHHIKEVGTIWLYIAAEKNYIAMMELLIQHGANAQRAWDFAAGITADLTSVEKSYAEEILFIKIEHYQAFSEQNNARMRNLKRIMEQHAC